MTNFKALGYGLTIGLVFGFMLEKSKIYLPTIIRQQMLFQTHIMLRIFLTASAVGMIVLALLEQNGIFTRSAKASALGFGVMKGYGGNIVGGTMLGAGITISGACPGTAWAQLGAGISSAKFVLFGGYLGALAFSLTHPTIHTATRGRYLQKSDSKHIDQIAQRGYTELAVGFALVLFAVVIAVEYFFPYTVELPLATGQNPSEFGFPSFTAYAWPPIVSGFVIGLLQVPSISLLGITLGASGSFVTIVSFIIKVLDDKFHSAFPILSNYTGRTDIGQAGIVIGIGLGSFISSTLGNVVPMADPTGQSALAYIFGGALLIFGARVAGGCASGHGISGLARLNLASVITICFMFVGGIGAAVLFYL